MQALNALMLGIVLTLGSSAMAQKVEKKAPGALECSSGTDKRTIVSQRGEGGGCDVLYTKDGQAQTVASARNEVEYCDGVVLKMKATLEGAGFTCK